MEWGVNSPRTAGLPGDRTRWPAVGPSDILRLKESVDVPGGKGDSAPAEELLKEDGSNKQIPF